MWSSTPLKKITTIKGHALKYHAWLHQGERKVRYKTLLTIGIVLSALIGLAIPAWAAHSVFLGMATNIIWIWD